MFRRLILFTTLCLTTLSPASSAEINPQVALTSLAYLGTAEPNGMHGSGVWKSKNEIITAKHVAAQLTFSSVVRDYKARIYHIDHIVNSENDDISLVFVKEAASDDIVPVTLSCTLPALLEPVIGMGHPIQMHDIVSLGHVMGTEQSKETEGFRVVTDLTVGPGASGGPVFNTEGYVFGILTAVALYPRAEEDLFNTGMTYVLPFATVPELCTPNIPDEGKPNNT